MPSFPNAPDRGQRCCLERASIAVLIAMVSQLEKKKSSQPGRKSVGVRSSAIGLIISSTSKRMAFLIFRSVSLMVSRMESVHDLE